MAETVDYIIVGAGSAGCVLANRLSANAEQQILLIEAGGSDRGPFTQIPLGYARCFFNPAVNWMYRTQKVESLQNREFYWPRGKVLGGSSSINAVVYHRGLAYDYNRWAAEGNSGWAWSDVEPLFRTHEKSNNGDKGEVGITDVSKDCHPLCDDFFAACQSLDIPHQHNLVDDPDGIGHFRINTDKGLRASSSNAFLHPVSHRSNLSILTHTQVNRLVFDSTPGSHPKRAKGVEIQQRDNQREIYARKGVIVCAGAIGSPLLLQRSGVGDPGLLQSLGIDCQLVNPNVGQHMQDHLAMSLIYDSLVPTLNNQLYPYWGQFKAALRYLTKRDGLMAMSVNQAGGLVRSSPQEAVPNLQLYFNPLTYNLDAKGKNHLPRPDREAAFSMSFNACRPTSRGQVMLSSPDVDSQPRILPNYLTTDLDQQEAIAGSRLLLKLAEQPALKTRIQSARHTLTSESSEEAILEAFCKDASTIYHPSGSCRMGSDQASSVVDASLRVHGADNLWIADASIFPHIPSANTNAPSMMVGEKAAALLRNIE